MKKVLSILFIISLGLGSVSVVNVFAQQPSISASGSGEIVKFSPGEEGMPTLSENSTQVTSATVRPLVNIRKLFKKTYRANEAVTVMVDFAKAEEVHTSIFNVDGQEISAKVEITSDTDPVALKISPPRNFKPGRYRVRITTDSGQVLIQDFTWGVLAINTNKSIYMPNETAKLFLAVLNEVGEMVCDAKVTLDIVDPTGRSTQHSTDVGSIKVNPACSLKEFTLEPDYEARYMVGVPGEYQMRLTAVTANGTYAIQDAFLVQENVAFDVERETITRVFPPATYPVVLTIKANQDFTGVIDEIVPDNFTVSAIEGIKSYDEASIVTSQVADATKLESPIFDLGLPFRGSEIFTQGFGGIHRDTFLKKKYAQYGVVGHDGVDFALPIGTEVVAASDGKVVLARENWDYGTTVVVEHVWGKTYYGHLSKLLVKEGDIVKKGDAIALSGNTGLSTASHLHFGIKPLGADMGNGYYGKINPLPYLKMFREDKLNPSTIPVTSNNGAVRILKWHVSLKKGEIIKIGYQFQSPPESPQFYLLGPLSFRTSEASSEVNEQQSDSDALLDNNATSGPEAASSENKPSSNDSQQVVNLSESLVFQEARQWQLAIDVDGSGTNVVSPTTGTTSVANQTYTFTFDPSETMDSGGITIVVPAGWSAPQGTAGVAGYTTATGSGAMRVARVLSNADAITGWTEDDGDACNTANVAVDSVVKQEGTNSIKCNNDSSTLSDATDAIVYTFSSENWAPYHEIGLWLRSDDGTVAGDIQVGYDNSTTTCDTVYQQFNSAALAADTWVYQRFIMTAARPAVVAVCILDGTGSALDSDSYWVDDVLIGPDVPTFSGSGPWTINVRFVEINAAATATVVYGDTAGGAGSTVTNSSSAGVHTFTTQSRISDAGTLTDISSHPTVTLSAPAGPTLQETMRHGKWFTNGVEQPFTF